MHKDGNMMEREGTGEGEGERKRDVDLVLDYIIYIHSILKFCILVYFLNFNT